MAGEKTDRYDASLLEAEDSHGAAALCAKQSPCQICERGFGRISMFFIEVGERYDGFNQL